MMSDVSLWVGDGECCGVLVGVLLVVVGVGLWWCVFGVLSVVWCICVCCRCERVVYCVFLVRCVVMFLVVRCSCSCCPRGPMDKASAYEAGDCGFESRRRLSFFVSVFYVRFDPGRWFRFALFPLLLNATCSSLFRLRRVRSCPFVRPSASIRYDRVRAGLASCRTLPAWLASSTALFLLFLLFLLARAATQRVA